MIHSQYLKVLSLKFSKPTYVELCILDLSKILMYKVHNHHIKNKYGSKSRLFLLMLIDWCMKLKPNFFAKILVKKKKYLLLLMISFFIDDRSEHRKAKDLNINVIARIVSREMFYWIINVSGIRWIEYKVKIIKHIKIAYEINKICLSWFDDKITIITMDMGD